MTDYRITDPEFRDDAGVKYRLAPVAAPPPVVAPPVVTPPPTAGTVKVAPNSSLATIQAQINALPVGGVLEFPAMLLPPGTLIGKSGILLLASGKVIVSGAINFQGKQSWTVRSTTPGSGFVFSGTNRLLANGASDFAVGNCTFNDIASNGFDGSAIAMSSAHKALIINNDFTRCQGNVLGMYDMDSCTFDGNHFNDCRQPFSIQVPNSANKTLGNNMIWRRNVFLGTQRAAIEVGPNGAGAEYFNGIIVESNFFDDFNPQDGPAGMLAISLVGQAAVNTLVKGNFVRKGTRPSANTSAMEWTTGTEFTGTGEMTGNTICGFRYNLLYKSGWNVHGNTLFGTPDSFTTNQAGATGTMADNAIVTIPPNTPPQPQRIAW